MTMSKICFATMIAVGVLDSCFHFYYCSWCYVIDIKTYTNCFPIIIAVGIIYLNTSWFFLVVAVWVIDMNI